MFRVHSKNRDMATNKKDPYSTSVDFARDMIRPEPTPERDPVPLWSPGVKVQESPALIMSRNLQVWRNDNANLTAAKAAEELDNLYASLPPEVFDLTFQDMIDRDCPAKKSDIQHNVVKTGLLSPAKNGAVARKVPKKIGKPKDDLKNKTSGSFYSIGPRVSAWLSPKSEFSSPSKPQHSPKQLDKLVDKRVRRSSSLTREDLYSASTTPASSFPRISPVRSPILSPRHSHGGELARSGRYLEVRSDVSGAGMPLADGSPRNGNLPMLGRQDDRCSNCSATDLVLKTNCLVCGRTYCILCRNRNTECISGGRKCKKCVLEQPINDKHVNGRAKDSTEGCWPFTTCFQVQASPVTKGSKERQGNKPVTKGSKERQGNKSVERNLDLSFKAL